MSLDLSSEPIMDTDEDQFCVEMMKRLAIQRRNEQFCDVILEVGSGDDQARLKAHRIVLCAASPFFYNALNSDMKEKKEGVIRLQETSKVVMEEVLEYLYTGHVDINERNAFDLLQIADFLVLPSLKELSSRFILRTLTSSNCVKAYCYAVRYQCPELEKRAKKFSFRNFMDVSQSVDFLDLSVTQVEKWVSSDDIVVKGEEEVFQVIVKWMERDERRKHESFFKLFCHVRLVYVSHNYVFNVILPHSLVKDSATCTALALDAMKELTYGSEQCYFAQPSRRCLKTHEDAIVVCGGWKETLCYLPSENKWYKTAHMPPSNKEIGSSLTSCHGRLYITGEDRADDCILHQYDPSINSWGTVKTFTGAMKNSLPGVVNFQGFLFVVGVLDVTSHLPGRVHRYNPDTNLWQEVASLNVARCAVCAVADKTSLYAIGGLSLGGSSDNMEVFDPEKNSWRKLASTITKKKKLCCGAVVRGKVFLFETVAFQTSCSSAIEMYDPPTNTWSTIEWMDAPKMSLSAVNFKGKIFVLGMWERDGSHKFAIKVYDVDKNEWTYLSNIPCGGKVFNLAALRIQRNILDRCKVVSPE